MRNASRPYEKTIRELDPCGCGEAYIQYLIFSAARWGLNTGYTLDKISNDLAEKLGRLGIDKTRHEIRLALRERFENRPMYLVK